MTYLSNLFDWNNFPTLDKTVREKRLPSDAIRSALEQAFGQATHSRKAALIGLTLLWHDHWDESHGLVQQFEGEADCDLVHGILHRREGDLSNARYWCRQVPGHPAYSAIAAELDAARNRFPSVSRFIKDGQWSPLAFLQQTIQNPHLVELQNIQALELKAIAQFWWPKPA